MQLHESMQTSCISTPCTEWCVGIQGVSVSYSQSLVACLGGLLRSPKYVHVMTDTQISVHILVTQCVYVSAFSTVHVVGEWHAHTLSCIPCASVHTCFLFFFYNPYMCQCKRALRLTLTLSTCFQQIRLIHN